MNTLNLALCEGRHEIPQAIDGAIFPQEINPLDVAGLERKAFNSIWNKAFKKGFVKTSPDWDGSDMEPLILHNIQLNLYVTGLSVALISVINALRGEDVSITLYHFNRDTNAYYAQQVR